MSADDYAKFCRHHAQLEGEAVKRQEKIDRAIVLLREAVLSVRSIPEQTPLVKRIEKFIEEA